MHQACELRDGRWDSAVYKIVGETEKGEPTEPPDIAWNLARDSVSGEVQELEKRKGGDASGDVAGDTLPVGDGDRREVFEPADGARDVSGHVTGAVGFPEDQVVGLSGEVDFNHPISLRITTYAVPMATVAARPRVEDAEIGLTEGCPESQ